jgi:hypothetical protein
MLGAMNRDYFALVEGFDALTEEVRRAAASDHPRARDALIAEATTLLLAARADDFEKLAVWHTDKFYRLLNAVDILDAASFVVLSAVGAAFCTVARERGVSMAYLVDNVVTPIERLRGIEAAFRALQFLVASPELFAAKLAEHDGIPVDEAIGPRFSHFRGEAFMLAKRVVKQAVEERRHFMWLSGEASLDDLRVVREGLVNQPFVGVFRNDAPVDGTELQIFQTLRLSPCVSSSLTLA